jgi:glucosamine--fructose-6-phosphate aminotransferase (isomerizing)
MKDDLLFDVISSNENCVEVLLAHTRWASMGVISEENTHPLDSFEHNDNSKEVAIGVLNGDIDNHVQLTKWFRYRSKYHNRCKTYSGFIKKRY